MWIAMMMLRSSSSSSSFLWLIWVLVSILLPHHLHVSANTEVDALIALKTNLVDPHNVLETWNQSFINPCPWFHITCNTQNTVTRIDLGNANLSGSLVPHLALLPNLQYLELYSNKITGQIPRELGKLTKLVSLDLYLNHLTGPIPDTLAKLQMLRFLRLNNNQLSGHIPMSLTTIKTLQVLDLSYNRLTGPIPTNGSFQYFTPTSFAHNHLNPLPIHGGPTTPAQVLGDET